MYTDNAYMYVVPTEMNWYCTNHANLMYTLLQGYEYILQNALLCVSQHYCLHGIHSFCLPTMHSTVHDTSYHVSLGIERKRFAHVFVPSK